MGRPIEYIETVQVDKYRITENTGVASGGFAERQQGVTTYLGKLQLHSHKVLKGGSRIIRVVTGGGCGRSEQGENKRQR